MVMKGINIITALLILAGCRPSAKNNYDTWTEYLGGPDRNHYSTLSQIDTNNVQLLKIAWSYDAPDSGQMEMSPIIVNGVVYGVTAALKAFALDATTGKELWMYKDSASVSGVSRGVAYWEEGDDKRIFYTVGVNLIALNANDGKLIPTFGNHGKVNLHIGLPGEAKEIVFPVSREMLSMYNDKMEWVMEPGDFRIMIGSSSKEIKLGSILTMK